MSGKHLQLKDVKAYKRAHSLSNTVWSIVRKWDYFSQDTIGKQLVRSMDSISANIAEGFGRYNKRDKIRFYRYSYGSVRESIDWIDKARHRGLIEEKIYIEIKIELGQLPRDINYLIKLTNQNLSV